MGPRCNKTPHPSAWVVLRNNRTVQSTMASDSHPLAGAKLLPVSPLAVAAVVGIAYFVARALYRLFFHPLAAFPGPKLAAVTTFYEAYYEIVLNGQYGRKISQLHDKYGVLDLNAIPTV